MPQNPQQVCVLIHEMLERRMLDDLPTAVTDLCGNLVDQLSRSSDHKLQEQTEKQDVLHIMADALR